MLTAQAVAEGEMCISLEQTSAAATGVVAAA